MKSSGSINAKYKPTDPELWSGRKSNPNLENQYWYQEIKLIDLHENQRELNADIALIGYACDEGVRRNHGRVGAKEGPTALRQRLAKLPLHFDNKLVVDAGDVICIDNDMESCQQLFSNYISGLIRQGIFPIALGGGHDMSYGHFMGLHDAIRSATKKKIGIINLDAHFDLRPVEDQGNSGTPFNQILGKLKQSHEPVDYFVIGIQQQSNTKELFTIAKDYDVEYIMNDGCDASMDHQTALKDRLFQFISNNDHLYITLDLDGFSSAYAPGVSAPSPLGFSPKFVFEILSYLLDTRKVIAFDIAELNPSVDRDNLTVDLAAKVVDFVVRRWKP